MNAHWIDVFYGADDHHVVRTVPHYLQLEFFPADDTALDEHLADWRKIESATNRLLELLPVVRDAAARSAERECGADDRRESGDLQHLERFVDGRRNATLRHGESNSLHCLTKKLPVFRHCDRTRVCSDELDAVFLENSILGELDRDVESGLPAHCWQQRVGTLLRDNELDVLRRYGLEVGSVSELRVRHDGGRIGVDEDHLELLFLQRLCRLRTRIVKLSSLTDDDRAGAYDQNAVDVRALRHTVSCDSLEQS